MSDASNELRRRAGSGSAWVSSMSADELRALADLVEDLYCDDPFRCDVCLTSAEGLGRHHDWCKLAAVERAFKEQGNE